MIIDRIEEQERYYPLHPDMELAFAFLAEAPDLEPGRYELENGLFASVSEGDTREMYTVFFVGSHIYFFVCDAVICRVRTSVRSFHKVVFVDSRIWRKRVD